MNFPTIATPSDLLHLLASRGGESYFGEPVTVLEHSLQAAFFATQAGSPDALIAGALLHDVGHLLHAHGEDAAEHGLDTRHEEAAMQLLQPHLPAAVTEPIRRHVAAKRYLCHADPAYLAALSPSSALSLTLQGGPMTAAEAASFLAQPFASEAVTLRRWDDDAKIPALAVLPLDSYLPLLTALWS
jgi:[1-hydroxy-2-(trimethylamino)ethyl]phosphonate dioxygenase